MGSLMATKIFFFAHTDRRWCDAALPAFNMNAFAASRVATISFFILLYVCACTELCGSQHRRTASTAGVDSLVTPTKYRQVSHSQAAQD